MNNYAFVYSPSLVHHFSIDGLSSEKERNFLQRKNLCSASYVALILLLCYSYLNWDLHRPCNEGAIGIS